MKRTQPPAPAPLARGLPELARGWRDRFLLAKDGDPGSVFLHTLTTARWVAVVGQLFTVLFVDLSLDIRLPMAALLPAIALSAALNLALTLTLPATTRLLDPAALALFAFDIAQLCYLLALTGGIQNPFALLMLVPVVLAAASLGLRATTLTLGLGLVGIAALALGPGELPWHDGPMALPRLYRLGAWAGLSISMALLTVFVWSIAEEARRRREALHVTQLALAREQQLSALGGQAAAVAHLLGSPLGTIAIIATELARELPPGGPMAEEIRELVAQTRRCRELLRELGQPARHEGEREGGHAPFTSAPLTTLLEAIAGEHARPAVAVRVALIATGERAEPHVALRPEVRHSLANLIDNAIRFAAREVEVLVRPHAGGLELAISDDGPGFTPEVLDWLGEPFLSTRGAEGGLGLGIFIAKTLLARTGATLHFTNQLRGARVIIAWPATALDSGSLGAGA